MKTAPPSPRPSPSPREREVFSFPRPRRGRGQGEGARMERLELPGWIDGYRKFQEGRPDMAQGLVERARQLFHALHAEPLGAEGAGQRGEVGVGQIDLAVFPEDALLEVLDGAVALVVEHEENDAE